MTTTGVRRFLLDDLPALVWLYEKRLSSTFWDLDAGWVLALQQKVSGPGPESTVLVYRPHEPDLTALEWTADGRGADDARRLATLARLRRSAPGRTLDKTRRGSMVDGVWWEIEEFHGSHTGLIVARRALVGEPGAPDRTSLPAWVGREVTHQQGLDDYELARPSGGEQVG